MDNKFMFLQPWQVAIHDCKTFHDSIHVVDSPVFRASHLPVHASIRCWPALPEGYEQLGGRCAIPVPFPANAALRSGRERLRRIREAMELFNVLAAVNRPAFLHLLAECIVVADNFDDLFTPDFIFVYPVWECYLVGTLDSEDVVAKKGDTIWGELFGLDGDSMQRSEEFQAAMEKLEVMRQEMAGMVSDFMGMTEKWSEPSNVIEWAAEHVAVPTKGTQVTSKNGVVDLFTHQLDAVLKTQVPAVVQLCAVSDAAKMVNLWEQLPLNATPTTVEMMKPNFSVSGGLQIAVALACMNVSTLRLNLNEIGDPMGNWEASVNVGFLLSVLVCGRSLCEIPTDELRVPLLQRLGTINDLQVIFARNSAAGPAGICSALFESSSIENLTMNMGTLGDEMGWLNQVRWGWLAYALWSGASNTSIETAKLTNIHLSTSTVDSVSAALTNCYPPSTLGLNTPEPSTYGFVDVQKGTKLRLCGLDDSDGSEIVFSRRCHCRVRYNPAEMGDEAEVFVPGYGLCTLQLGDERNTYIPDMETQYKVEGSNGVLSLTLEFFEVENPTLVPNLLSLIGGNLRSLKMGMFWSGRRRSILLDGVAVACPHLEELYLSGFGVAVACSHLEELYLSGFGVALSNSKNIQNWRLKKLAIQSAEEVASLSECLSDPGCRMARELEELEITIPRSNQISASYVDALTSHNGDYIAVRKEKLPRGSKIAMISVVNYVGYRAYDVKAVHRLNETLMGFTFAFAATPKRRSVRIIS